MACSAFVLPVRMTPPLAMATGKASCARFTRTLLRLRLTLLVRFLLGLHPSSTLLLVRHPTQHSVSVSFRLHQQSANGRTTTNKRVPNRSPFFMTFKDIDRGQDARSNPIGQCEARH